MKVEVDQSSLYYKCPILYPCPIVLLTCSDSDGRMNITPLAWVGVACSTPPIICVSINPKHYSYELLKKSRCFVLNIPSANLLEAVDFCGNVSGRDVNKFVKLNLTQEPAKKVKAPLIKECPVNLECVVRNEFELDDHIHILGDVILTHIDQAILDEKGDIDYEKAAPITYHTQINKAAEYYTITKRAAQRCFTEEARFNVKS